MLRLKPWIYGLLGALILALPLKLGWRHRTEDFIYEYGASRLYLRGQNPYDVAQYQAELAAILGRPNPFITNTYASAYPPAFFLVAGPLCQLPIFSAFEVWNAALLLSLILLWLCAARLLGIPPSRPEFWLLTAVLATFPGAYHSLFYHRSALTVLAFFAAGLLLWERGRQIPAAFVWGFLAMSPQWFAYVLAALVIGKKYRAACVMSWLAVYQLLPYLSGVHPWGEAAWFLASLSHHARALAFLDDQSLGMNLYKLGRALVEPGFVLRPFFEPSPAFLIYRKALFVLSWLVLWFLVRSERWPLTAKLAWVPVVALLGSVYSHNGDQMWIIPALIVWLKLRNQDGKVAMVGALLAVLALNFLAMPSYGSFAPYLRFSEGFWTLEYLALAFFVGLIYHE